MAVTTHPDELDSILRDGALRTVFQPVVDLADGEVVGVEALARGPEGSPLESPGALFQAARAGGRLIDLERACEENAVRAAENAASDRPVTLFLNAEPEVIDDAGVNARAAVLERAVASGPTVIELTERALTARPAELLRGVRRLRDLGCAIALDDVGADQRSLALMPFLRPDVIKLDLGLVQPRTTERIAEVIHAVSAQALATGARVVAEGIETDAQRQTALAFGAELGQGFRYGRPGPWGSMTTSRGLALPAADPFLTERRTPYEIVRSMSPVRTAPKHLLMTIAGQLETQAAHLGEFAVLLATFQERKHFTARQHRRYAGFVERTAFTAIFGEGMPIEPTTGVRGQNLRPDEPLRAEWDVTVIGPHFAVALACSDLDDDGPDLERRFDFAVTYDRDTALRVARLLMARIGAAEPAPVAA